MLPSQTPDADLPATRQEGRSDEVFRIIQECLKQRASGQEISDESVINAHPELMPELRRELTKLRVIAAAHRQAVISADANGQPDVSSVIDSAAQLRVRCPNCPCSIDVHVETSLADVICSSCGHRFNVVGDESIAPRDAANLQLHHFELLEQIGTGGFGTVWKARDKELDRLVAVKFPRRGQLTPDETQQFLREARAAAQLKHPNIVSVHEVGRDADRVYIVSDLVEGPSLAEWNTAQRMSVHEAAAFCQKVAEALSHAHAAGIIHRDLKPANILIDVAGQPHLTDFGLASRRAQETTVTLDGQMLGTPAYMSPEQARGEAHTADPGSDIFSLGVILYELLTGELPFRGSVRMLLEQIIADDPPRLRSLNSVVPSDLETICLKCLEKDPARRYATAQELADDLGRFLHGEPIVARPVSLAERTCRWCRRNRRMAGLSAAVAALLLIVAAVTTYSSVRSRAAAREARWQQYLSDMRTAVKDWDEGDVSLVVKALDRHRPGTGEQDLRRFEWYYLSRNCQLATQAKTLLQDSRVNNLAVSPDGQWLAVTEDDETGTIEVWHLPTKQKRYTLAGHGVGEWVKSVAFSPDSQTLVSGALGGDVFLWDMATGNLRQKLGSHEESVWAVAYSPNGDLIASAGAQHTANLWDAITGALLDTFTEDNNDTKLGPLEFSPDGQFLAAGSYDHTAMLWDTSAKSLSLVRSFTGHAGRVVGVAYSPDGSTLATGSADKTVKLWNVADGTLIKTLVGHTDTVRPVAFAPGGKRIASGSWDGTVRLWDSASGDPIATLRGHSGAVMALAFAPDGHTLISGGADGTVRLWPTDDARDADILRASTTEIWGLDISGDGDLIAAGDFQGNVTLWDLHRAVLLEARTTSSKEGANCVAFSPNRQRLAIGDYEGNIELWVDEKSEPAVLRGHAGSIGGLAWSPDGQTLAAGDSAGGVILWDVNAAAPRLKLPDHELGVGAVTFSPDGSTFVTRCQDGTLQIWDPQTGQLRLTIDEPAYYPYPMAFSPDGRVLASGSTDHSIKFWDTSTWRPVRRLRGHTDRVKSLAFSSDRLTLASSGDDGQIKLWEVATGEERCSLRGHHREVEAVRFTPDGTTLVSSGQDGTVRIWRTAPLDTSTSPTSPSE